ncbi:DUF6234 family protein [Streptomyces sp. NPDC048512]|uniref:DUF6234 family protein n=1 Tax=Streptomyces sp. NPDC048512 TaxID=3365563 RepID=UPI003715523C
MTKQDHASQTFPGSFPRRDGFAGGCIGLIALLIEIPMGLLLGLAVALRGWGDTQARTAAPTVDWAPIVWCGGFTLAVLLIAGLSLYMGHPFAGVLQLLLAAVALAITLAVWHDQQAQQHRASVTTVQPARQVSPPRRAP